MDVEVQPVPTGLWRVQPKGAKFKFEFELKFLELEVEGLGDESPEA